VPWRACARTASGRATVHSCSRSRGRKADPGERAADITVDAPSILRALARQQRAAPPPACANRRPPGAGARASAFPPCHDPAPCGGDPDSQGPASPRARWPAGEAGGRGAAASSGPDAAAAGGDPDPDPDPAWARATLAALVAAQAAQQGRLAEDARRRHLAPAWGADAGERGGAQGAQGYGLGLQQDGGMSGAPAAGGCRGCEEFDVIAPWLPPAAGEH
jgi:hypothetical protein